MIDLSFSTVDNLLKCPHTWVNKQAGVEIPNRWFFDKGTEIHRLFQDHFLGVKTLEIEGISQLSFDVLEKGDFDEDCHVFYQLNDKYRIHGYVDGRNTKTNSNLEIKSGSKQWTYMEYKRSKQRKTYVLCTGAVESTLITVFNNLNKWNNFRPKVYTIQSTEQDKIDALNFYQKAIDIIDAGDFSGGLENNVCQGCSYGRNCLYYVEKPDVRTDL